QAYIEGHLRMDEWTSQDGQKRSKLKVVVDNVQFLQPREGGAGGGEIRRQPSSSAPARKPAGDDPGFDAPPPDDMPPPSGGEDIPFGYSWRQVPTCHTLEVTRVYHAENETASAGPQGKARRDATRPDRGRPEPRQAGRPRRGEAGLRPQLPATQWLRHH